MKTLTFSIVAGAVLLGFAETGRGSTLKFDGVDDYVRIEDNSQLDLTTNYTIECWFRAETLGGLRGLVGKYHTPGANGYLLRLNGTQLDFDQVLGTSNLVAGVWYHAAAVNSNGTRRIYLNGSLLPMTGTPLAVSANGDPLCLGRDYLAENGRVLSGQLDEVRIWSSVRSQADLVAFRNRRLTGTEAGLVAYFAMDEGMGTATADSSGHGNTGTLYNGVVWNSTQDAVTPAPLPRPATQVAATSAQLNASVIPSGERTTNQFLWGGGSTALEFDGVDDVVTFSNNFNVYPLTVTARFKTSKVGGSGGIVNKYISGSANGWNLRVSNGRLRAWYFRDNSNYVWDSAQGLDGGNVDDGRWHHTAFIVGPNGGQLYVDGVIRASRPWTGTPAPPTTPEPLRLGNYWVEYFAGLINDVTIWNKALSREEVTDLALTSPSTSHPSYANLLANWRLDGDLIDARGSTPAGTFSGLPSWVKDIRPNMNQSTAKASVTATNSVLNLDGVNDFVDVPDATWFSGDFTIEAWVYARNHNYWSRVIDFGNGTPRDNVLLSPTSQSSGKPALNIFRGTADQNITAPDPIPLNEWVHLAGTLAGNIATLYVNGVPVVSGTMNAPNAVLRTNNFIGRSPWAVDGYADCLFENVRLWKTARTTAQLRHSMREPVSPSDPDLILNYKFDEASGDIAVDSRSTSPVNGIFMNRASRLPLGEATAQLTGLSPGKVYFFSPRSSAANGTIQGQVNRLATQSPTGGTAVEFDGVDDVVRIADFGAYLPTSEVTVEFWARVQQRTQSSALFSLDPDTGANRFLVHLGRADNLVFWDFGDITATGTTAGRLFFTLPDDITSTWQHFAFVASKSGQFMRILRNGTEVAAASQFNDFAPGNYDLILGRYFKGAIDEFRVWTRARSNADIRATLNERLTGNEADLLAYYRADEGAGSVLFDSSTNAFDGLLVNGTFWSPSGTLLGTPIVATTPATFLAADRVRLNGLVNTASYKDYGWFQWGTATNYDRATTVINLGSGSILDTPFYAEVSGLLRGVTYHYRAAVSNTLGTVYGEDRTFCVTNVTSLAESVLRDAILAAPSGGMLMITNNGIIALTNGELALNKDLTLVGPGANDLGISGGGRSRVINVASNATVTISGLAIQDGHSPDGAAGQPGANGGGILNQGTLTLNECVITNNTTGRGANGLDGSPGTYPNNPVGSDGGGGFNGGHGGGLYNDTKGTLRLNRCTIINNSTGEGGNGGNGGAGITFLIGFNGGSGAWGGTGGYGAGIFNAGDLTVDACLIAGNTCGEGGDGGNGGRGSTAGYPFYPGGNGGNGGVGGVGGYGAGMFQCGSASIVNSTASANSSGNGGLGGRAGAAGGSGPYGNSGVAGVAGSSGNGGAGGGLYVVDAINLESCTISYNRAGAAGTGSRLGTAGSGGGIRVQEGSLSAQVRNTIIAKNLNSSDTPDDANGVFSSQGGNLISIATGTSGFQPDLGDLLNTPPLLLPLADNGGPTRTHALWPESPAMNSGVASALTTDQRGLTRVACTNIDIGAFEYGGCPQALYPAALKALYFDGFDDYFDAGEITLTNSFTIEAWAKRDWIGTPDCIVSLGTSNLIFGFQADNSFTLAFSGTALVTTNSYTDTEWHHWAGTYDTNGRVRMIYVDGKPVATNTASADLSITGRLRIGNAVAGGWPFDGEIDEVRIWKVARTSDEIRQNHTRTLSGSESNLVAYYRFDGETGSRVRDAVTGSEFPVANGQIFVNAGTPLYQPIVTTLPATSVRATTAVVQGLVNPAGHLAPTVWVEYDTSLYFEKRSSYIYPLSGVTPQTVTLTLTNLESGTRYYYRVCAANSLGTVYGNVLSLDTLVVGKGYPISTLANNGQMCLSPHHVTDQEGGIYLAGQFTDSVRFDVTLQAAGSMTNAFLAKLARKGDWRWATSIPVTNGVIQINALALDANTNILAAGYFSGTAVFGTNRLTSASGTRGFLARFTPAATNWTWAIALGAGSTNSVNALAVGVDSAIYLAGQFSGNTSFGTNTSGKIIALNASGGSDGFVARFSPKGMPEWAAQFGGAIAGSHDAATAITLGPFGEAYITGFFMDQGIFGMQSLTSAGASDMFFAALNVTNGLIQRVVRAGGSGSDTGSSLVAHPDGSIYVIAQLQGAANFSGGILPELDESGMNLVVAQISRQGVLSRRVSARGAYGHSMAISPSGAVYLAGDFEGVMRYGTNTLGSGATASSDVFLAQITEGADTLQWGDFKQIGGIGAETCGTVSVDRSGSIALSGTYAQTLHLGDVELSTPNSQEIFIARVEPDGVYEHNLWEVGKAVDPPLEALEPGSETRAMGLLSIEVLSAPAGLLDSDGGNSFLWNQDEKRLYALRPVRARIKWRLDQNVTNLANVATIVGRCYWPEHPQTNVAGVPVEVQGPRVGKGYFCAGAVFNTNGAMILPTTRGAEQFQIFQTPTNSSGYNVIHYTTQTGAGASTFDVVYTRPYGSWVPDEPASVGQALGRGGHEDSTGKNGYVLFERSFYDGSAHERAIRKGPIIPVNVNLHNEPGKDMVVVWYRTNAVTGIAWGCDPVRYAVSWPADAGEIVIASAQGRSAEEAFYPQAQVYHQADTNVAGFNPNEEHALIVGGRLYALRCDLNETITPKASDPYVLLKYLGPDTTNDWRMKVYKVLAENGDDTFAAFTEGEAGLELRLPEPLSLLGLCAGSNRIAYGRSTAHETWNGKIFAKSAGYLQCQFWYPMQPGFYFGPSNPPPGTCVPWMSLYPQATVDPGASHIVGEPVLVGYHIFWPTNVDKLYSAETLTTPKNDLPDLMNFASARIIYDDGNPYGTNHLTSLVRIFDPLSERTIQLPEDFELPDSIAKANDRGRLVFPDLPYSIRIRLFYDELNQRMSFGGWYNEKGTGEPLLLPNILSSRERERIKQLDGTATITEFDRQIERLYDLTRNPNQVDVDRDGIPDKELRVGLITQLRTDYTEILVGPVIPGPVSNMVTFSTNTLVQSVTTPATNVIQEQFGDLPKALTAGLRLGSGYVTIAENDAPQLRGYQINLHLIYVTNRLFRGDLKVLESDNVFDERLTLRHSADFAGEPQNYEFEWYYQPDQNGTSPPFPVLTPGHVNWNGWIRFPTYPSGVPNGFNDITLGEGGELSSLLVLSDNWLVCRYRNFTNGLPTDWSEWVGAPGGEGAMLAMGWINRVIAGLNTFDSRIKDFHEEPAATYASMVLQAGERYEGPIAFNPDPDYLNQLGLIESYETILERGRKLSIDGLPPVNFGPANNALLRAAGRIADLYVLLGNEAYADASDPTIGFTTSSGEYGNLAPSIFCFQNQLDSPLDEELALLRGRDNSSMGVRARPIYNRLLWNFTQGDGEVAYKLTYNISDQDSDGFINETDARILYPQGHGDAWGHYLTATKSYYRLLRHPYYEWIPRPEAVTVSGSPVQVDYLDERRFSQAAAAKAKAGAEIVNLTYRQKYVENPSGKWQGYKDTDSDRAWGVDEWARRAGTGAYFDWVVANAILPATDPDPSHAGIQKIDRTTVTELADIPSQFAAIEAQMDIVDRGLNPLGLAAGAMPFDIDPSKIAAGQTHFDQIYERALKAMENALALFNHANALSQNLRRNQDDIDEFTALVEDQEQDYKNRLIEIFGYPFAGDIGPTGAYPSGYDGPDVVHFMYVNASDLTGDKTQPNKVITAYYRPLTLGDQSTWYLDSPTGVPDASAIMTVNYPLVEEGIYKFQAPTQWAQRRAPGEAQNALGEMLKARAKLNQAMAEYDKLLKDIQGQLDLLETYLDTSAIKLSTRIGEQVTLGGLSIGLMAARASSDAIHLTAKAIEDKSDAAIKSLPTVVGMASDVTSAARGALKTVSTAVTFPMEISGTIANQSVARLEEAKEIVRDISAIAVESTDYTYARAQNLRAVEQLIREEVPKRIELYTLRDELQGSYEAYLSIVAKGQRLMDERYQFRTRTAAKVQEYRYQDMGFRVFQNDALQKYRAQFELAARYVYLAAKAYDYETCLLNTQTGAGSTLLTDIVRQRTLGQLVGGLPVSGRHGLADPLARLGQNFEVYRGQLGFTTPETETGRFSLRSGLFRTHSSNLQTNALNGIVSTNQDWHAMLQKCRVADLWRVPEFRRFCRPFAPESAGPQPGLVIRIPTTITFGLNYFGWPLGPGDSAYDSSRFATKVRSAGVWFKDYNLAGLSMTPRVYLVPAGLDIMRSPSSEELQTREFNVVDQKLPVPFPIGATDLRNPSWIPANDSLSETFGEIRRFSSFRAYHDQGSFDESEATQDTRLIGRSVWNTEWLLIIPGGTFLYDPDVGLDTFIATVDDIKIFFQTYSYSGN